MVKLTHLSLSGGGALGAIYIGVIRYLLTEKYMDTITNISGNSIGSVFALMIALKMPYEMIEDYCRKMMQVCNSENIDQDSIKNILEYNGATNSEKYLKSIKEYIFEEYGLERMTFIELSKKLGINLYISATKITNNADNVININKIFSLENTPDVCIIDAVCASISIPFAFKPYKIDNDYYVDGILSNNLPIKTFNNFKNVDEKNILSIAIGNNDEAFKLNDYSEQTSLLEYMSTIFKLTLININNNTNKYLSNTLIIKDNLPIKKNFNIIKTDNCFKAYTTEKEFEDMILVGYIEISKHIDKRKKEEDEICIKDIV
jgi:NTE family protein